MTDIVATGNRIPAMSSDAIAKVNALAAISFECPQEDIETHHAIHGGMYARTISIKVSMTPALIEIVRAYIPP